MYGSFFSRKANSIPWWLYVGCVVALMTMSCNVNGGAVLLPQQQRAVLYMTQNRYRAFSNSVNFAKSICRNERFSVENVAGMNNFTCPSAIPLFIDPTWTNKLGLWLSDDVNGGSGEMAAFYFNGTHLVDFTPPRAWFKLANGLERANSDEDFRVELGSRPYWTSSWDDDPFSAAGASQPVQTYAQGGAFGFKSTIAAALCEENDNSDSNNNNAVPGSSTRLASAQTMMMHILCGCIDFTFTPTISPTSTPSKHPTRTPSVAPQTSIPSLAPTTPTTRAPSRAPSRTPSRAPIEFVSHWQLVRVPTTPDPFPTRSGGDFGGWDGARAECARRFGNANGIIRRTFPFLQRMDDSFPWTATLGLSAPKWNDVIVRSDVFFGLGTSVQANVWGTFESWRAYDRDIHFAPGDANFSAPFPLATDLVISTSDARGLFTGIGFDLENGDSVFETCSGWTSNSGMSEVRGMYCATATPSGGGIAQTVCTFAYASCAQPLTFMCLVETPRLSNGTRSYITLMPP